MAAYTTREDAEKYAAVPASRHGGVQVTAPVLCRQCGDPVPPDREGWATPMCHKCLPPIGTKRARALSPLLRATLVAILSTPAEETKP